MAFSYRLAFGPIFFLLFLCFFIFFTKLRNADVSLSLYQDLSSPSPFITLSLAPPSFPQPHLHSSVSNDRVEDKPNGEDGSVSNDRIVDEPNGEDGSVSNDRIEDKPNGQDGSVSNDRIEDKPNGEDGSVSNDRIMDKPNGEDGSVSNDRIEDKPNGEDGSVSNDRIVDEPNGEDGSVSNDRIEDKANGKEGSVSNGRIEDKPNGEDGMVSDGESATARGDLWMGGLKQCDLHMGTWVRDEVRYPVYRVGSCPYVDEAYDCGNNGRPDSEYTKWRWKPYGCDLPRFNATDFLVRLRGKRLMLVGDSMNRNQFESILCLLREGLRDKKRMFETHGYKITKGRGYFIFKFKDYDCTVEFVRSHFLVREGIRINAHGNSNPTLSIDRIDKTSARWKRADILVFNTGHWWTHGKTARGKNYYKEGNFLYPQFDAVEAYRRALKTWGNWIDRNINPAKQLVFYRGYSSAHFRGGDWDSGGSCNGETEPVLSGAILNNYPLKMKIVEETIKRMKVPVILLNVTRLTNFRKDGHPSVYSKNRTAGKKVSTRRQDCSHWCLPGVPDAWNELIYAALVARSRKPKSIYLSNTQ